ncbi:histone-lysine N-methyltransferase ASHR1 [Hyalella azteca]|uniref:Histone-lysine N-methyltransferase ASHR1 n=1 Tax=Hyalella azteca TaxID=294128 RepID=A0A8B7P724_HYAAZ|nr:histone-lysine N-methyltransferase ASHR1 [Hyalella azteca]XP_018021849.1 histone-lysine N-methyltransferase ASHR1 [Hyalella azteca]
MVSEPCSKCGRDAGLRCSRCLGARYCSKECQREHWPQHRGLCKPNKDDGTQDLHRPSSKEEFPCAHCSKPTALKCSSCRKAFYCSKQCQQQNRYQHKHECFPFKVQENEQLGRYLVATKDLKAGDVLLKEDPLVVSPLEPLTFVCLGCYKPMSDKNRCSRCGWPVCGPQCEELPQHVDECRIISSRGRCDSLTLNDYKAILSIRCSSLKENPEKLQKLMEFQTHEAERRLNKMFMQTEGEILSTLKKIRFDYKSQGKDDNLQAFVAHVMGTINVNGFEIPSASAELMGLYPIAAFLEHSCSPNTKHKFSSSHQLVLKAAVDIKEGEHVTTTYTKLSWGTSARRKDLLENKYFLCCCKRCSDATEYGTFFSALKCKECKDGYCLPDKPLESNSQWTCDSCKAFISYKDADERTNAFGGLVETAMVNPEISQLEYLLRKIAVTEVHPNHFHLFKLRHTLLQLYGRGPMASKEEILVKKETMCREFLEICSKLDPADGRLGPYTGVVFFEYHDLVLIRSKKLADKEYPDEKLIDQCVDFAKKLLIKCIKVLQDEEETSPEGLLRIVAQKKYAEMTLLTSKNNSRK